MATGATPRRSGGLPALLEALRLDGADAEGLFKALLSSRPSEPGFMAWVEQAWGAFLPGADRAGLERDIATARRDDLGATLLFARLAFATGHEPAALAAAQAARAWAPKTPSPCFLVCAMLLKRGDPAAQDLLRRCFEDFPQPSQGWSDLGEILQGVGKPEAALICFGRGEPGPALALRQGLLARGLGRLEAARAFFAQAVQLDPQSPRAWFLLGAVAQDLRDLGAAARAYRMVLSLDPGIAEAAVNLGTVLQESGDLAGAKTAYGQAVATRADTFGRVAQALTTSRKGELWLDLEALRRRLAG